MKYPLDIDGRSIHVGDIVRLFENDTLLYPVADVTDTSIFIRRSDGTLTELDVACARPELIEAKAESTNSASSAYYKREGAPEAIDAISGVCDKLGRLGMTGDDIWLAGTALKYALRAGIKTKDPEADYRKCADYLYRLACGVWPWEVGCSD